MATYKTKGIILKRSNFGEADRLVTILTENHGKIRVLAKGSRKIKSKLAGHLELFCLSKIILAEGRNLDIVTDAKITKCFLNLRGNLAATHLANYLAEVIDKMTDEGERHAEIFVLMEELLDEIDGENTPLVISYFELKFLTELGYEPQVYHCVLCKKDLIDGKNYFSFTESGVVCPKCHNHDLEISIDTIKLMRLFLKHRLDYLKKVNINDKLLKQISNITEKYLRTIHQKEFNSRRFLK